VKAFQWANQAAKRQMDIAEEANSVLQEAIIQVKTVSANRSPIGTMNE